LDFLRKPWLHQAQAIEKAEIHIDRGGREFALFMEVGTGKTLTLVNILRCVYMKERRLSRTLILSPIITLHNWKKEVHMNSKLPDKSVIVLEGAGKKKLEQILKAPRDAVLIGNYEMLYTESIFDALNKWGVEILVCDESHKLKNPSSKRTKAVIKIADKAKYRFIMTGTPVLKNLMDLWAQVRILDGGKRLFKSFFQFRNRYFVNMNSGNPFKDWPEWAVVPSAAVEIGGKMAGISHQAKKSECLDLPPLVKIQIETELTREQRNHYNMMKNELITFIKDEAVTASIALTKALKLQQIVSGFVTTDEDTAIEFKETPREEALEELLDDLCPDNKVIVWAVFKKNYATIRRVCEKLKIKYVEVHGEIDNKTKFANVDAFNNDHEISVLIGHPGSGGVGINLVSSNVSIFYSRNFSLEYDVQAEARNYRGGSEIHAKVTRYDIVSTSTIDQEIVQALSDKTEIGVQVLKSMLKKGM
jgi:SNF2 family DNA or RNA helicase